MTRKQAVLRAIIILEKDKKNSEVVKILNEIYDELPLVKWSTNSILDSIQDYLNEHNNVFPPKRLFGNKLPTPKTIKRVFNVESMKEFREKYFSDVDISKNTLYGWYTEKDYIETFIENYNMINNGLYVKYEDYNLYRKIGSPAIETIIKNTNCNSYNDLICKCGIKKNNKKYQTIEAEKNIKENSQIIIDELKAAIKLKS